MRAHVNTNFPLPPEQQAIRDRCFHPSGTFTEFPIEDVETSIPARFEKVVELYPDRIAINSEDQILTYAELNCQANRLALSIVDRRGDTAEPIAILLENGAALMAATLGVLKAGKFVVLLDPSFPESRNAAILEDSQARMVISNRYNASVVSTITNRGCQFLEFEAASSGIAGDDLHLRVAPNALAILVYTSGSTGQPKGVMQDHRSRLHQCMWSTNTYHICAHDRSSLLASGNSHAVSISLRTLLNGAMLLPFDIRRKGVNRLAGWLLREKISICVISSPLFRNLCETLTGKEMFPDLRLIRLSSETVYRPDFDLYKKYFAPTCLLANGVSPSETGALTAYLMDQETDISGNEIPVGYPLEDIEVLLLDDDNKEVGPNRVGEIAVKSRYLSLGYWQKPALTEAKFKPDPEDDGRRLYLTGDLGLMLPDGCLFHKGRKDYRVKIRGHGVEIAEVENALRDYVAVGDAVVMARRSESGEARLVAYFSSASRPSLSASELRRFLKHKLPDYMIPSAFVMLDAMPLTPSGKVDRQALPDPKNSRRDLNTPPVAPRTSNEEKLVTIFAKELRIDHIGIHDNFFDLGGHSLSAMRVISQIRDDLQIELTLRNFFETPTVAALASYFETALSPRNGAEMFSIQPASRDRELLPSFAQQSLLFIDQLEPASPAYNLFSATELRGHLNVLALKQSFNEVIRRHESLRTVFKWINGQPFQNILPALTIVIPVVDLRDITSPTEREAEIRRLSIAEARRPFDLDHGPLLRTTLLRLTKDTYVLFLTVHHIVFDGWSRGILDQELSAIYKAFSSGQPALLPALPIQYVDFAQWHRQRLQDKALQQQLAYWKKQLENLSILKLPSDRSRPATQTFRGAKQSFTVPEELVAGLKILTRREGVTLFMTLLAAYVVLLHRYTGQNDIGIGSPIFGRERSELENLIGLFINILVLRTDLSGNPTFRELLSRVRTVCLEAYANPEAPFERLVQELRPERSLSHNPLFQATFALQNGPTCLLKLAGVTAEDLDLGSGIASFDFHLFMIEDETSLNGRLIYSTDLFDASSIARMIDHFQMMLEAVVADPDQRISDLPILTTAEKHRLLVEWNDTKRDYPSDKCIHELFEAQVEKTPDAIALVFVDQQLTYRELNNRANQLAHYLRRHGVGPDVLVGINVERSMEMIVGLLGILKAGGAFVPLDPSYPQERLRFMLEDTRTSVVLTDTVSRNDLLLTQIQVVSLDRDWDEIAKEPQINLQNKSTAEDLAYLIYTSGSTGLPKGVEICHRGVARLLFGVDYAQLDSSQTILQLAPISFDAATFEVWGSLLHGGKCVLFPGNVPTPQELGNILKRHQVTILWLTGTLFNTVIDEAPQALAGIKQLLIGGEALSVSHVKKGLAELSNTEIINGYGPTESTTFACCYPISHDLDGSLFSIPIGKPITNTQAYILDSDLNPVPIGVAGELHIGGDGLARGYLNRPELTTEKFIANLFINDPQAQLYKTGDLARYLPDGNIEFLGRIDGQVKIRGYRIELGEIESVLAQHPAVQQAVVLTREDAPGDKRLVAYVVGAPGSAPTINELRSFLKQKLPEYMVPSAYVFLESLPLTPNGKVDRKALPEPDQSRPELDESFAAPRTSVEEILSTTWAGILKLDKVGIHDNFFQLGGHSLLATQVISRINDVFATDVQVRRLFETPTIAGLAASIDDHLAAKNDTQRMPPIVPRARTHDAPLSFAQQRLWFLDRLDPNSATYNVPAAFRLAGKLDARALEQSFNEIVRRHEALRTVFTTVNGEPAQTVLPPSHVALTCTDISDRLEKARELILPGLVREEACKPFDLIGGPLLRTKLLRLAPHDHILCLNMHHIVSDGWSMGVLFRELSELYQAYGSGKPSSLPELSVQYVDYSVWQRQWLQGEELDRQLSYWRKQLGGISPLHLPTDRTRPTVQTYRGSRATFELSAPLSQALKALSQQQGVTLFMTLLASFQLLLSRYCGQIDIAVGSPIAGRTRHEIERLIGFFVNTLVLRTDLSANPTFKELLRQVRETTLDAYSHQDLPFEKLVEELHPQRNLSHSPLFQVMFAFQNNTDQPLEFEGLTVQPIRTASDIAKFDLTLTLSEKKGTLGGSLNYNTDLFDASTIERMLGHFQNLLEGIVTNPEQRISELPLLSEAEKHQLLVEWNDTTRDYPSDKGIHELFEAQVEKTPDATALVFEDQQLTYRELNNRANQLAHYLQKHDVGPDMLVGICTGRSIEMVVGLLGILKAGGAYLPLDPSYPEERLEFVLADAGVAVLLIQTGLFDDREVCPDDSDRRFSVLDRRLQRIFLDRDWQLIAKENDANPESSATADHLAYVIYTSGSTGQPKGVAIEHRNTAAFLAWVHNAFSKEDLSGVLASTSLCFDLSVFEIFAPLSCGGTVILVENALALATISKTSSVSLVNTVPSAMTELLNLDAIPPSVRVINLAGEPLPSELVRRIFLSTAVRKVHDLYGPTECTTYSTWICRSADGPQSIGRPIANTQIYILDAHRNPVPIGFAGEIYVGGDGVARGYLNRPELTAERFIYDSFDEGPKQRLYRTGDLARYLPDGNIEFLGRVDDQVKIRGYRIELGEIEAVLGQDPWIQDAVVIARGNISGDRQLVAYVVPKRQTGNSPEDPSWAELQEKKVSEWQTLFDQTFAEADEPEDPTTNTAGVNSSYTNSPVPAAESRDWIEHAAQRILSLSPNRVLDIGCGLGRTLFRIAPDCSRYWGVDFSQAALEYVEQHLHLLGNKRAEIKLIQANADNLSEIPARHFDTVVINGVTQYFPHIEHLVKVLEGALDAVEPGGVIFVGDVRSLPLLEPFQLSVELFRASDDVPAELLWQTVKRNVAQEEELLVDPAFFSAICHHLKKIDRADVLLKRGWAENELTRFRYDVILYVKPQEQPRLATAWLDWSKENLTLSSVRELLKSSEPRTLGIARVPNARVLPEYRAAASLARGGRTETARALRDEIETMRAEAFHPESFWALQNDLPYWVDLTWSNTGGPECFDVFFQRRDLAVSRHLPPGFQKEQVSVKSWHMYAHSPTEAKRNRLLGSFLRSHLKKKVPDYMIPSSVVVLDALPLTPNGKIDRKALPAPDGWRSELDTAFIVPSTPIEEIIATIWKEVLGIQRVGIHDNFFDLGGHSLLATQVVTRMRRVFQSEIPLRDLFEFPTIAELAATISGNEDNQTPNPKEMERLLVEIEAMSDDEAEKLLAVDGVRS